MKIAFFGTYFYNFEKIIHNSMKEANLEKFYFFTDKKSYLTLLSDVECSYVNLSAKNIKKNIIPKNQLHSFFCCDKDRFDEFNIKHPKDYELNNSLNLILNSFTNWYKMIKPDILISEGKANFFNRVIIDYLEKKNIDHYSFRYGRISSSTYLEKNSRKTLFNNLLEDDIDYSQDYMDKKFVTLRNFYYKLKYFSDTSFYRDLKSIIYSFNIFAKEEKLLCYTPNRLVLMIKNRVLYIKKRILDYIFKLFNLKFNIEYKDYLIYPEHYRPEASTSAQDYKYINDFKNVVFIKRKIKENIVFRFHPSYFTKRPLKQFFKIINSFKKGLSLPNQSLKDLIYNSRGTILISSTVGIESLMMGKPTIILGNPEYIKSRKIADKVLLIRSPTDYKKIPDYIQNYKKINKDELVLELKKLYHPFHPWSGRWIKVIIKDFQK